ncbi:MAG: HAMP domain-containing protein [Myxococcales bacterium]|nr:HAMP domain-containing protein [Myxococcales bacterium]
MIASTVAVLAVIIAVTTLHSRHRQVAELKAAQDERLLAYSGMLSLQVRSAVAFADQATAREVLDSLNVDPEIAAIVLFSGTGERLYEYGTPSAWVAQAAAGVTAVRMVSFADRHAVVTPVVSLEGPRGTLVIEVSMDRITAHDRAITRTAIAAGAIALLVGCIVVWLITRPMLRRLRRMAEVAGSVGLDAEGNTVLPEELAVEVDSKDELGSLGKAFNHMVTQLRAEQTRLREAVAELTLAEKRLEQRVERRTESLKHINLQLRKEMEHRTKIELELRQAQKLESVGRLASGIAHEINTPVQFVSDSVSFLETATRDLMSVIATNRETREAVTAKAMTVEEALAWTSEVETEADVDYLLEQIPLAVERALQGMERVSTIVRSMKEFAHPDHAEAAPADVNRAITSTITVARNEYKYLADLETDLGDLPMVSCHLGELNQVVLNLVINAAHAIESVTRGTDRRGKIAIRTTARDGHVVIEIADDGCGIPTAILDRIFDPFFTTKEVGKGTGQGLAIARSVIVDKHHGKLTVDSVVGRGTTFRIWLPLTLEPRQELALAS